MSKEKQTKKNNYLTFEDCIAIANDHDKTQTEQIEDIRKSMEYHDSELSELEKLMELVGLDYDLKKFSDGLSKGLSEKRMQKALGIKKGDMEFARNYHKHYSKGNVARSKLEMLGEL